MLLQVPADRAQRLRPGKIADDRDNRVVLLDFAQRFEVVFRRQIAAALAVVFSAAVVTSAQVGELHGHVFMTQADGTKVPLAVAVIDVYRTDVSSKYNTKTDKKGEWVFAGIPYIGTYTVAASHPTAQPSWQPGVKAGRDIDVVINLTPGDCRRLTLEDIKALGGGVASSGTESAADRAKREEAMKKNAEIEASNKRAEASNAIIERTFKAGNEALRAKNFDLAIAQYDEGLTADPDHPGAPALLANKTMALSARAVERHNAGIRATDDAAKQAGLDGAKKDWTAAAEASSKAVTMLKAMPAPTDAAGATSAQRNMYFALLARADAMRLYVPKVDPTKADEGVAAFQEYIAVETDPVKKAKAQNDLAQMLFDSNAFDKALVHYQKILETNPDDLNALLL